MRYLHTEIEIAAPAVRVWEVLTDFARYPAWNPSLRSVVGEPVVGERLVVQFAMGGGRTMTMRPRLLAVDAPRELRWLGTLGVRGLFDGEHAFRIEAAGEGRVRFVQSERFSGVLVPLMGWLITATGRDFAAMNRALKARVEAAAGAG